MTQLRILCLGSFQATLDNEPLAFDTDKSRALLAYLAIEGVQPQRRDQLAGLLWSDAPEERALHNLRQALSGLRKALHEDSSTNPFLLIQRDTVQINLKSDFWLDVNSFEQGLTSVLRYYRSGPGGDKLESRLNLRQLQQVINLFRGPFLDQLYLNGSPLFDEWAGLKREVLNQHIIEALSILTSLYERRGEIALARQYANQMVALAPWDENAHVQVLRLLAIEGQWNAALAHYHHLRRYLHEQIGVEPSAKTMSLFENIRQCATADTPFPAQRAPARHNLPLQETPFIGRDNELDAIAVSLADPCCRLLTLIGPGGVGKTRLALEAARQQIGTFNDGVFFVPLVTVQSDDLLPAALASALDFSPFGDKPTANQVLRYVVNKHMLWLLDTFEQLLPLKPDSLIVQILQHAPGVVLLVTSRQRLNLKEECLLPLSGLDYPDSLETPDNEKLDALQLFVNRARRVQPTFTLSNATNRQATARICQLLEGLPLGVELAAAALWSHSLSEIATRLTSSLRSLESAAINVSDRHRSLWAAFEFSWTLISTDEQRLLTCLSVFRGGFEAEMAQQVVNTAPAHIAALVDKSLLRRDAAGRYDLHEAIRQFAFEKLTANPDQAYAAQHNHAHALANFLFERTEFLKSANQHQALADISIEWDNARQAWAWLVSEKDAAALTAASEAVFHFCTIRARFNEGIALFAEAAKRLNDFPAAQAKMLTFQGALAYRSLDTDLCEAALQRALVLFSSLDTPNDLALCLVYTSGLASRRKNPALARQHCEQSLKLFEQTGNVWGRAIAFYQIGLLQSRAGRAAEARLAFLDSLQAARLISDRRRQIGPLNQLGDLACQMGAYTEAQAYFEESLALSRAVDDFFNIGLALINLGTTFHCTERYDQAESCYLESLTIFREIGDQGNQSLALTNLGELALVRKQYANGLSYFQQALKLAEKAKDDWAMLICWINLCDIAVATKDLVTAQHYLGQTLSLANQSGEPALILRVLLHQGRFFLLQGKHEEANALLGLVIHHEATYDEHRRAAQQALQEANLPVPLSTTLTIETAMMI